MIKINKLAEHEKVFLAGAVEKTILADGSIQEKETQDLDKIIEDLGFDDYEKCLDSFEAKVKDSESFWQLAGTIQNEEAQDAILNVVYELSLQDGVMGAAESRLFNELKELWQG